MDLLAIGTALGAANATFEMLKTALAAKDDAQIKMATIELTTKLLQVSIASVELTQKLSELQAAKTDLEREIAKLREKFVERESYVLHEISKGLFCYKFRPIADSLHAAHYLCQPCYDKGTKSVLQFVNTQDKGRTYTNLDGTRRSTPASPEMTFCCCPECKLHTFSFKTQAMIK